MIQTTKSQSELIRSEMTSHGETPDDVIAEAFGRLDIDHPVAGRRNFTIWTKDRVYFPDTCTGGDRCASVPRNPNNEATMHVGR